MSKYDRVRVEKNERGKGYIVVGDSGTVYYGPANRFDCNMVLARDYKIFL